MPQFFDRRWNVPIRLLLFGAPAILAGLGGALAVTARSPYATGTRRPIQQPVPFSHAYHTGQLRLDCRLCHAAVEDSPFAGMPTTRVCLDCHRHVWTGLRSLEPLEASATTGVPLAWQRLHDLPDYACFDHSIHLAKGIGCVTCHGRIDRMNQTWQMQSLNMAWCLECHREPENYVRPRQYVFDLAWRPPGNPPQWKALSAELNLDPPATNQRELGTALAARYRIERKTSCSVCHR